MPNDRDIFNEVFGNDLRPVAEAQPAIIPLVGGDASAKLGLNLGLALERQGEILASPITPETDPREKRLIVDTAHQVVKVAAGIDASRLQARGDDNALARVFQRIEEAKKRLGARLGAEEILRLDAGPSSEPAEPNKRT